MSNKTMLGYNQFGRVMYGYNQFRLISHGKTTLEWLLTNITSLDWLGPGTCWYPVGFQTKVLMMIEYRRVGILVHV